MMSLEPAVIYERLGRVYEAKKRTEDAQVLAVLVEYEGMLGTMLPPINCSLNVKMSEARLGK